MGEGAPGLWRHSPWPIIVKCARERCRPGVVAAWGLATLAITTAVCLGVYLSETERFEVTPADAARAMIVPVIIIQAVILMFLGTGSVAYGIAGERDSGVLDYQRMTPMSTPAKLVGYVLGLPIREYVLFALTMPFLVFAVVRGEFAWGLVAHFYLIFFFSVVVYHMTGMVAGMVTPKARRAAVFAQVFVVVLYFALPNLSRLGLTFFEFLTIRPALFGLIQGEITRLGGEESLRLPVQLTSLDTFRAIPFFATTLHPTIYTILVQTGLIATMWHMIARRWRSEESPGFSKVGAAAFMIGSAVLIVGSAWAALAAGPGLIIELVGDSDAASHVTLMLTLGYTGMILAAAVFALANASPSPFLASKGFHRMRRHGWSGLGILRDESTSLPLGVLGAALTIAGGCVLYHRLIATGIVSGWPSIGSASLLLVILASIALFAQAVFERFAPRGRFVVLFIAWALPVLIFGVLVAAEARPVIAAYAVLPCPPAAAIFALDHLAGTIEVPPDTPAFAYMRSDDEIAEHFPMMPIVGAAIQLALAIGAQAANLRDRTARRRAALHPGVARDPGETHAPARHAGAAEPA
jgi:hypothetical protein